jgi:hypothetical protein
MTSYTFTKAVKQQEKLRLALDGPAGSGKTWTALIIASDIADRTGGRVAVIDSERSSARKYAADFDFDHLTLPDWSPHTYMGALRAAEDAGYAVVVIDSFSHAWEGVLELKDNATARSRSKNSYTEGWREATPVHNQLVDAVLRYDGHVIATLRTKTEYVIGDDSSIRKVGLKPIQREGVDFEFDVVGDMTAENSMVISKTRCSALAGQVIRKPDRRLAETLWNWLNDGEPTITPSEAQQLADTINAKGQTARAAWLEHFAVPPKALGASRLAEAQAFVADLPAGNNSARPGEATDREAVDPTETAEQGPGGPGTAAEGVASQPSPGPSTDPPPVSRTAGDGAVDAGRGSAPSAGSPANQETIGWMDIVSRAQTVFEPAHIAAPRGKKGKTVERLRHALIYACTNGATTSSKRCTGEQLYLIREALDDIADGRMTYRHDDDKVTFTNPAGQDATVTWTELEDEAAA